MPRKRIACAALALLTLGAGLATRPLRHYWPGAVTDAAGDILWALLVYLLLALAATRWSPQRVFAVTVVFAFAIETSQLYHAPWLDALRRTTLGGLILGWGFAWTDLLCYLVGAALGLIVDRTLLARHSIQ